MDHFAKETDELSRAYEKKKLFRNFQGYTAFSAKDLIGFGMSSIGFVGDTFIQNEKELSSYYAALDKGSLPCIKGKELGEDDAVRRLVIQEIMCRFEVDKKAFYKKYGTSFDAYFQEDLQRIHPLSLRGLVVDNEDVLKVTPLGELFVRNIASCFDAYLHKKDSHKLFSKAI